MKSGNLNFLETSGPLRACYRTALPLPEIINIFIPVYADSIHALAAFIYSQEQRQKRAVFHINPLCTLDSQVPIKMTLYTNTPVTTIAHFTM